MESESTKFHLRKQDNRLFSIFVNSVCTIFVVMSENKTRTNWPRKVRELIPDFDSRSQKVGLRVPGSQGVGLQGPRVSRGNPTGSQGVRVGLQGSRGSRGRPKRLQEVGL